MINSASHVSQFSLDGKWLWTGSEWIPAPQRNALLCNPHSQPFKGSPSQPAYLLGPSNRWLNILTSIKTWIPGTEFSCCCIPIRSTSHVQATAGPKKEGQKALVALVAIMLIATTSFWLFSPQSSPFDSIRDSDGDGHPDDRDALSTTPENGRTAMTMALGTTPTSSPTMLPKVRTRTRTVLGTTETIAQTRQVRPM